MLSQSASVATKSRDLTLMMRRLGGHARTKTSVAMSRHQQTFGDSTEPSSSPSEGLNPVPDFNNIKCAYKSKTTPELLRAAACFRISRISSLVNNAEPLLIIARKILGGTITDRFLKSTFFGHFCAGEDLERIQPVLHKLNSVGIGSILDYAAENEGSPEAEKVHGADVAPGSLRRVREYDYESEVDCDNHVETFKKCIRDVASLGFGKDGYAAIKVTALGNPKLLARMSQAIVEAQRLFEQFDEDNDGTVSREDFERGYRLHFNVEEADLKRIIEEFDPANTGMVDYITWSMNLSPKDLPKITSACREVGPLALAAPTEEEIELIEAMYERGHALAKEAAKCKTCLLIDAEQVRFQPAIDNLVLNLQQTYNAADVSDFPVIYNTYQCYLKDSADRLRTDVERADRFNYHFGAKLVRGAYMESERKLAETMGFASPIHDTMEDTHKCYDESVEFLLEHSTKSDKRVELMCATHNQLSIEKAIKAMNKYGVDRSESIICFAQLYGMKDNLSFNLGKHGYRAYKYVPYGEVHEVMPYLLRRARENSAIVGGAVQELCLIRSELRRRIMG